MRILIAGGTGFIGSAAARALTDRGDEVIIVSRSAPTEGARKALPSVRFVTWSALADNPNAVGTIDAIVNLAGESINQRWTAAAKARILQSRIQAADRIASLVAGLAKQPKVVVNASGISGYGASLTETFDERSPLRAGEHEFLAAVVREWEAAADRIPAKRLVKLRIGLVIAAKGGAFPLMALPYRLFVGGPIGGGKQWLPWIHLDDMVRLIQFAIDNDRLSGPVNAVAPEPLTNDAFGKAVGKALRRPHWLPLPGFMMKAVLGEMAALLLEGQRALPCAALEAGFEFRYPTADKALRDIAGG